MFDGTEYWYKFWKNTDFCFQTWHEEFSKFSPEHVWKSKNWNFYWVLLSVVENVWPLRFTSKLYHDNKNWCKIWRGIDLSIQNSHEEFEEFWPKHSKISKICIWMGCFWPKYIMFVLNKYRVVIFARTEYWWKIGRKSDLCFQKWQCVITMKNDAKFEEDLSCLFKIDMRNLKNFDPSTPKSQIFVL